MSRYAVGIDLGTTHCTVAYASLETGRDAVLEQLALPQIVAAGVVGDSFLLPSSLYFPTDAEVRAGDVQLPWATERSFCVGAYARDRAAEVPDRVINSAKSWLCQAESEFRLPQGRPEELSGMTPGMVLAELLRHIREVWDLRFDEAPLVEQQVVITVPASFDPAARERVRNAAREVGYPDVILMEEPQAAFYAWLHQRGEGWREDLIAGDLVLVVDIGGGTSDYSLIKVVDEKGMLGLERVAVGEHLLLGGDNMDLALAYRAKFKLEEQGHELDEWQMQKLVHSVRVAKEKLLSQDAPEEVSLAVEGRGRGLIANSLHVALERREVEEWVVEGFLPLVERSNWPRSSARAGLRQQGLYYAEDPRISAHIAKFLNRTSQPMDLSQFVTPSALLFNGGVMKGAALRARVVDQLCQWTSQEGHQEAVTLEEVDLDRAVSRGAAYYAWVREEGGVRIRSGTSHSYWVGVEEAVPAVPGMPIPMRALCVAPFGMEEGSEVELVHETFHLTIGESALFRFFRCGRSALANGLEPQPGTSLRGWQRELEELRSIETVLDGASEEGRVVAVTLKVRITELGVLELWCLSETGQKWKFEFETRSDSSAALVPSV